MEHDRNMRWLEDINKLAYELPKKHKCLFFYKDEKEFYNDIEDLRKDIEYYDDYEMQVKLAKIVASFKDAHTSLIPIVKLVLPFEFYWFQDGIYVIGTIPEYQDVKYNKLMSINNVSINEVVERISTIISYENEWYLKSQLPKYLQAIDLLYGLEIIDEVDYVDIVFKDTKENIKNVRVKSFYVKEVSKRLNLASSDSSEHNNKLPLYRRNFNRYYWFEYLENFKTLYFKYNACRNMEDKSVLQLGEELIRFIKENGVRKIIIDLRNNLGGDSTLLDIFINDLSKLEQINQQGKIFIIIGRETFSSALLNMFSLKEKTSAIFLGEPTGGKPNCYGEVEKFELENSGIIISCSTKYYKTIEDEGLLTFIPDINIKISIEDYKENRDPCLEAIGITLPLKY